MKPLRSACVLAVLVVAAAGCKSDSERVQAHLPVRDVVFQPERARAGIAWVEGRYPDLFDAASFAVWGGAAAEDGADAPGAMAAMPVLVIDLYVGSVFADMSVAYDVVGLRGIDVALETGHGERIRPAQILRDEELIEEPRGTLRFFGRKNQLVFPVRPGEITVPVTERSAGVVRLVLQGHGATFQFVWPPLLGDPEAYAPTGGERTRAQIKATGEVSRDAWQRVREFSHTFD